MITTKEIAELAGVSRGTVDRALHRRDGVKPEVAQRIREIADRLGYVPDRAGKALATRRNPVKIGAVFHAAGNPFFDAVMEGIRQAEGEYADSALQVCTRQTKSYTASEQCQAIESLKSEGIQALILTPVNDPTVVESIERLTDDGVPVICMNSDVEASRRLAYVGCDYLKSGATAAQLAAMMTGSKARVGIVIGSAHILGHTQRVSGFHSICENDYSDMEVADVIENGDDDILSFQRVSALLKDKKPDVLYFAAAGITGGLRAVTDQCSAGARPLIIASDETPVTIEALQNGTIQAVISQQPFEQGYRAVCLAFDAAVNRHFPETDRLFTRNEIRIKHNI